jgi:flagella basal body P-ring formation protein FlgA
MQVKRPIASGHMIRQSDIVKPQVVRQGDGVEMVYSSGNIKLRTNGIASGSGAIGDTIRVKNESTGTIVSGVIKSKNLVEVGGEE